MSNKLLLEATRVEDEQVEYQVAINAPAMSNKLLLEATRVKDEQVDKHVESKEEPVE